MLLSVTLRIKLWHLISETTLEQRIIPKNWLLQDLLYQLPIRTFLSPNQQPKCIYLFFNTYITPECNQAETPLALE